MKRNTAEHRALSALVILALAFLLGGILGCVVAGTVDGGGNESLVRYLQGYLAAVRAGAAAPEVLPLVWELVRWPLFAVLLGFTDLGVPGLPILFAVRGFLLSFAISSFVCMFGGIGGLLAFLIFGLSGLIALPVLFVLGAQSFCTVRGPGPRPSGKGLQKLPFGSAYALRCGVCASAISVCVLLEKLVVPPLLAGVAGLLIV